MAKFNDVSCSLMYDVLHDGDYRRCWDENMVECYEICQLDRYNDIGYYSSKLLVLGYSALLRIFVCGHRFQMLCPMVCHVTSGTFLSQIFSEVSEDSCQQFVCKTKQGVLFFLAFSHSHLLWTTRIADWHCCLRNNLFLKTSQRRLCLQ